MWPLLLLACGTEPSPEPDPCEASPPAGTVEVLATGFDGTEGVAFSPDGRLFVATAGQIAEIAPATGEWTVVADVPEVVGLAWWGDALFAATFDLGEGGGGVVRVDVDSGEAAPFASGIDRANFVTVTPWGTLLVSDDFDERVFEVTAGGETSVWLDGIESPNGMAFDAAGTTLFVATTFARPATIWAIPVADGRPGTPASLHDYEPGTTPDGLAVDVDGNPLVALNLVDRIDRIGADGPTVVAEGVPTVASLAYGVGEVDRCAVVATSLFGEDVYLVATGTPGTDLLP